MTDVQLLTIVLTLLAVFGAMYSNRKSTEDMRDVLRAESKAQAAEMRAESRAQAAEMSAVWQRIENKLDHLADTLAGHSERVDNLGRGKQEHP